MIILKVQYNYNEYLLLGMKYNNIHKYVSDAYIIKGLWDFDIYLRSIKADLHHANT